MKYIKLFENFNNKKYEVKDGKLDLNDQNKYCKLIAGPFLVKNPDWENMPLIADDYYNSLLRITNNKKEMARCNLDEVVQITKEEWEELGRLEALKDFFKSGATGKESQNIRGIYKHFKNGGSIDDLEPILKNLYKDSPGIFNFSNFTKEQFIEIIDKVGEDNSSFRELLDKRDDTPSFDISSIGTAYNWNSSK